MRSRLSIFSACPIAATCAVFASAGPVHAESLADAIAAAYQSNPTLLSQREQLQITDEAYVQSRAGYRPQVNIQVTGQRQDYAQQTGNTASALLTVTQPLYSGGRIAAAVGAAEADDLSGRETLRQTEADTLQAVIQAYADVLRDQEGVGIRKENLAALNDQLTEAQARSATGDLTRTDVSQSLGYVFQAKADLASARAQLATSEANFTAVVGHKPDRLEPPPPLPNVPVTLEQAARTVEAANPALRSSQYEEQAARLRTAQARDQRLPSVSLQMQLGPSGPVSPYVPNVYSRDATAVITITQPLFAGGVINSQVRQQIHREAMARLQTEGTRRAITQQLSQAWSNYQAARENIVNATEEVKADQAAYDGMQMEQRADLRSTLEVLYVEQSLRQAQLGASGARHDAFLATASLLNAMGLLNVKAVAAGVRPYDPEKSFRAVSREGSVPWEMVPETLDRLTAPAVRRLPEPAAAANPDGR